MPSPDYALVRSIGRGNFGVVSLVKHVPTGKECVMKQIPLGDLDEAGRKATLEEVVMLKQLDCAFIVRYADSWIDESSRTLHIVMAYCHGGDLHTKIQAQSATKQWFSEEQILDWFISLCIALRFCHDKKILHRDIKAQNIFLTRSGDARLGDFGIARQLNSTAELAMTVIGTPYCMSPEVCESKPYGFAADVWALGCVLYQMCALHLPFEGNNLLGLVYKIVHAPFAPIPNHYSPALAALVASLLVKQPADRPSVETILRQPLIMSRAPIIAARLKERKRAKMQQRSQHKPSASSSTTSSLMNSAAISIIPASEQSASNNILPANRLQSSVLSGETPSLQRRD